MTLTQNLANLPRKSVLKQPLLASVDLIANVTILLVTNHAMNVTDQYCQSLVARSVPLGDLSCECVDGPQDVSEVNQFWLNLFHSLCTAFAAGIVVRLQQFPF